MRTSRLLPLWFAAAALSGCGIVEGDFLADDGSDDGDGGGPPPPALMFTVEPDAIAAGEGVTLAWNADRADRCVASGDLHGAVGLSGDETASIFAPGNYSLTITCAGAGGQVTRSETVAVTGTAVPVVLLEADPPSVAVGASTQLTWSTDMPASCFAMVDWFGPRPSSGTEAVAVTHEGSATFRLTCLPRIGEVQAEVVVTGIQATVNLTAAAATAGVGQMVTLTWTSTQATACTASGGWSGARAASGSEPVEITALGANDFSLTCNDPGAEATDTVTITGAPPSVAFRAFPPAVRAGEEVTLSWEGTYATACTASDDWSGAKATSGFETFTVGAAGVTEYTLTCSNGAGMATHDATVTASAAPALPAATGFQMNARHDGFADFGAAFTLPPASAPAWSRDLGATVHYALVADGRVIAVAQNFNTNSGRLYALDPATGATLWGPVNVPGQVVGHSYGDGRVFVQVSSGLLRAYDAATGNLAWSSQLPGFFYDSPPTAYGGRVFVTGADFGLHALDPASGAVVWHDEQVSGQRSSPAVTSSGVYTMQVCRVDALNPATGMSRWRREAGCSGGSGRTAVLRGDRLFVRNFEIPVAAGTIMDAATGADAGEFDSAAIPAVSDTHLYTLTSGTLAARSLADGSQAWDFTGDGQLTAAPIVVNDSVFIGSGSGAVFAVDAQTGAQQWTGLAPRGLTAVDEGTVRGLTSLAAGEGWLLVPAGRTLSAWPLQ